MSDARIGMPNGWFPVAYSDELAAGEPRRVRYFDRSLELEREHDGRVMVRDDAVAQAQSPGRAWPAAECNGFVLVWHHGEGAAPDFAIPTFPEWRAPDWTTHYLRRSWRVRTNPQRIVENAIDWEHLSAVHGMAIPKEKAETFDGKVLRWAVGGNRYVPPLDAPRDDCLVSAERWGLGFGWLRYNGMFSTVVATGVTPIDHEIVEVRLGVIGKRDGRTEAATQEGIEAYLEGQASAMERDIEIWESERDAVGARRADAKGVIAELRRWAEQFYSGAEAATGAPRRESRNG